MKQTMEESVNHYVRAWNLTDVNEIIAVFEECMSADCTYSDKNTPIINGLKSIVDLVLGSHKLYPGRVFSLTSTPEYFDNQCRYFWHVAFTDSEGKNAMDYVEYDADNKFTRIVGFL